MKTTMRIRIALLPLLMFLGVGALKAQEKDPSGEVVDVPKSTSGICDPQVWEPMDEEKEEKCTGKLSVFHSDVKQQNYNGALSHWRYYFCNCPKEDNGQKWVYIDGAKIMVAKIKENKANKEVAKAYYDTLMMIYDNWIINYGEEGKVTGYKGLYTYAYQNGTLEGLDQARAYFEKSMELEGEKSTYQTVNYYMSVVQKLTKYKKLDTTYWVEKYFYTSEIIDQNLADSNGKYFAKWQKTREDIDNMMAPVLTCDQLIPMYEKKMTEEPSKEDLAKMVIFMERKGCTESETYEKAASMLCNIEPSATCKAALGKIKYGKSDYSGAIVLFKEALELQENPKEDAKYHLSIADCYIKMGSTGAALSATNSAIANDPSFGRAYMLRGSIYATLAKSCKDFEKKAAYWVVVDQFIKAKNVDPSLSETCNSRITTYSAYFPATGEIFFQTDENGATLKVGESYTVKCLGVSTTIRAKTEG